MLPLERHRLWCESTVLLNELAADAPLLLHCTFTPTVSTTKKTMTKTDEKKFSANHIIVVRVKQLDGRLRPVSPTGP